MGERNCAVDGCDALEFRTTGICNRHLSMGVDPSEDSPSIEVGKHSEDMAEPPVSKPIDAKTMSPNEFHTKMCYVLMAMAVIGGVFSFIGYILAPDSCGVEENTLFESLGYALFVISMFAVPINITIWLGSLFKSNVDSGQVFALVCLHTLIVILIMFVFGEYIIQDMFCNSEVFVWGVF